MASSSSMENEQQPPQDGEKVAAVPSLQESSPSGTKVVQEDMSSYEAMIKMFPLSTFLVLLLLLALKSDHVGAWWGIAAYHLALTDFQFGVLIVAAIAFLVMVYWVITTFRKRNQQAVESRTIYLKERAALIRFFEATGGLGVDRTWKDRTYWGTQEPLSRWKGVFLNPYTKRVNKLILGDNGLTGKLLGDVFADLPELIEIDLRENDMTGHLPAELCQLQHLEGLYLYGNRFTGLIPLSLADPPRRDTLTGVFLFNNEFDNSLEARKHFQETLRSDCYVYV